MSLILGIAIGVAVAVVALGLIYHNNKTWFAQKGPIIDAIAAKVGVDLAALKAKL